MPVFCSSDLVHVFAFIIEFSTSYLNWPSFRVCSYSACMPVFVMASARLNLLLIQMISSMLSSLSASFSTLMSFFSVLGAFLKITFRTVSEHCYHHSFLEYAFRLCCITKIPSHAFAREHFSVPRTVLATRLDFMWAYSIKLLLLYLWVRIVTYPAWEDSSSFIFNFLSGRTVITSYCKSSFLYLIPCRAAEVTFFMILFIMFFLFVVFL